MGPISVTKASAVPEYAGITERSKRDGADQIASPKDRHAEQAGVVDQKHIVVRNCHRMKIAELPRPSPTPARTHSTVPSAAAQPVLVSFRRRPLRLFRPGRVPLPRSSRTTARSRPTRRSRRGRLHLQDARPSRIVQRVVPGLRTLAGLGAVAELPEVIASSRRGAHRTGLHSS